MQRFALLLDSLTTTPARNGKLALLVEYFRSAPDPDRGFALGALTDGLFARLPLRRALTDLMAAKIDPVLYQMSRDYVGDTAETVALLWPDLPDRAPPPRLAEVVAALAESPGSAGHRPRWRGRAWSHARRIVEADAVAPVVAGGRRSRSPDGCDPAPLSGAPSPLVAVFARHQCACRKRLLSFAAGACGFSRTRVYSRGAGIPIIRAMHPGEF